MFTQRLPGWVYENGSVTTGGLDLFPASAAIPPGPYRASLEACGVPYQWLDAAEVMRRWPAFRLDADVHGLWQADAGMVPAAHGTRVMQRLAARHGSEKAFFASGQMQFVSVTPCRSRCANCICPTG